MPELIPIDHAQLWHDAADLSVFFGCGIFAVAAAAWLMVDIWKERRKQCKR
jgi:hypothetical protein